MTAADFSNLHLQYKAEQAEGEVPAVIEHDFPGGRMVDHYFVTPSPAFWAAEGRQSLDGVSGILFLQQPDGAPWKILVHEPSMIKGSRVRLPGRRIPQNAGRQRRDFAR